MLSPDSEEEYISTHYTEVYHSYIPKNSFIDLVFDTLSHTLNTTASSLPFVSTLGTKSSKPKPSVSKAISFVPSPKIFIKLPYDTFYNIPNTFYHPVFHQTFVRPPNFTELMEHFQHNAFLTLQGTMESSSYRKDPERTKAIWINFRRWIEINYDIMKSLCRYEIEKRYKEWLKIFSNPPLSLLALEVLVSKPR